MRILVLYAKNHIKERRTIKDHLLSFKRYGKENQFIYLNVATGWRLLNFISNTAFDAVLFHYTFLGQRFNQEWNEYYEEIRERLIRLRGVKIIIPHDDYYKSRVIWDLASDVKARLLYASCYPEDYDTIYPREHVPEDLKIKTVFTGYVEESLRKRIDKKIKLISKRPVDIGYRALEPVYTYGKHGQLKSEIYEAFNQAVKDTELLTDIKLTYPGEVNVLKGLKWIKFLLSCKTMPGCLGGSSVIDIDGDLREKVERFLKENSNVTFAEVEEACLSGDIDGKIKSYLLGPRHFECAMTKTCQLLVEGDYHSVFEPGVHYIEIKKDFSNLEDVIRSVNDMDLCQKIADQCYEDVVLSQKYTYRVFVEMILKDLQNECANNKVVSNGFRFFIAKTMAAILNALPSLKMLRVVLYHGYQKLKYKSPLLNKLFAKLFLKNAKG